MQFRLDNHETITLTIQRKPRMKHLYLRITPDGVVVSANRRTKLADIEAFVYSKSAWLRKHLKVQEIDQEKRKIITGNEVYFKGDAWVLQCNEEVSVQIPSIALEAKTLTLTLPKPSSQEERQRLLDGFYNEYAITEITPLVDRWSKRMNLYPSKIGFRRAKRRWGSCSSQNALSFNYYLMKLPLPLIEYVVVHELSHIQEKNHSMRFWALVEQFLPNYKELIEALREFERRI